MGKLTALAIKQAKPKDKSYILFDGEGLYLDIQPSGLKYWRVKYRYAGKEKKLAVGKHSYIGLKEARETCAQAKKLLAQNIDPSAKKQADKKATREAEAKDVEQRLKDPTVILNSFIISWTRYPQLKWDNTQVELEDMHVLFMTNDRDKYIDKLFVQLRGRW